jgi:hypothetical protein
MLKKRESVVPGIILILLGAWLLIRQFDALTPYYERIYPFLLIGVSVALLTDALRRSRSGAFFWSVVLLQIGTFFLVRNYGIIADYDSEEYWPLFLFAFGVGFYVLFLYTPSNWGLLIPSCLFQYFGLLFASHTFQEMPGVLDFFNDHYWPVFLILSGVVILLHSIKKQSEY